MALVKVEHRLEEVSFSFDDQGTVVDALVTVNYAVQDDATGEEETRVRKTASIWDQLTASQKGSANSIGKRLRQLAQGM